MRCATCKIDILGVVWVRYNVRTAMVCPHEIGRIHCGLYGCSWLRYQYIAGRVRSCGTGHIDRLT